MSEVAKEPDTQEIIEGLRLLSGYLSVHNGIGLASVLAAMRRLERLAAENARLQRRVESLEAICQERSQNLANTMDALREQNWKLDIRTKSLNDAVAEMNRLRAENERLRAEVERLTPKPTRTGEGSHIGKSLKPCPFCGGEGRIGNDGVKFVPYCDGEAACGCHLDWFDTRAQAEAAWNQRIETSEVKNA